MNLKRKLYEQKWRGEHKDLCNLYAKEWRLKNPERFNEIQKKWRTSHKKQWNQCVTKQVKKWQKNNPEKHNIHIQKWRKTETGRKYEERHRHRRYGWIEVLPNIFEDCIIDHHHINKLNPSIVIPLPRKIHRLSNGRNDEHFEENKKFIKKTYMINPDIFLGRF